jgi:hypothetical protein
MAECIGPKNTALYGHTARAGHRERAFVGRVAQRHHWKEADHAGIADGDLGKRRSGIVAGAGTIDLAAA